MRYMLDNRQYTPDHYTQHMQLHLTKLASCSRSVRRVKLAPHGSKTDHA